MSNYWKKRLDELQRRDPAPYSFNKDDGYWQRRLFELQEENEKEIAPVKTTAMEDDRKWFEKGALEDGITVGNVVKTILGTGQDVHENLFEGVYGIAEKAIDTGAYLVGGAAGLMGADKFRDKTEAFIEKDLIDEERLAKFAAGTTLPGIATKLLSGGKETDDMSVLGEKSDALVQSGGQLAATIGLQSVGVPWWVTSGVTGFGGEAESALKEGATYGEAGLSAAITAGAEILSEKLFGGSGLGEKGLINVEALTRGIASKGLKLALDYGIDVVGEGLEEGFSQFFSNLGTALYKEENLKDILFSEEALDGYLESAIGGGLLGGVMNVGNVRHSAKTGRDYRSGLTTNEQKVIDKEIENRIAEQEKDGKKLTTKEKNAIYDDVIRDMERGYISTDTIEEVLGGETYKTHKDTIESEKAMQEEYDMLYQMKNGDKSDAQIDRQAELKQKLEDIKQNFNRNQLGDEVMSMVKGDRLVESYNERLRQGQDFAPDFEKIKDAKYEDAARKTLENAASLGMNNTNKVHDIVDFATKIAGDTGNVVYLKTNEQIKAEFVERQTAEIAKLEKIENPTEDQTKLLEKMKEVLAKVQSGETKVNGNITEDGIVLNLDSDIALNRTVGHEVMHSLEKAKHSDAYRKALFSYAKTKGVDIDGAMAERKAMYAGISNAQAEAELVADMTGEYLFSDEDFVRHLSVTDRNVFQKIYDEIKYLCKITTAGSKEARELERVKRTFEKIYREGGKVQTDTKYSLENGNKRKYNKRSRYSETETLFLSWENSSAPVGEVKRFVRFGKVRYYEKTENGCVELSKSQYNERRGLYVEDFDRRAERRISGTSNYDESTQRGSLRGSDGYRHAGGNAAVFGQTIREKLPDVAGRSESSTTGHDSRNDIKQSEYNKEASDESGASFTFSNDYAAIRNYMKEGDTNSEEDVAPVKYSLSDSDGMQLTKEQQDYFKDSKVRDENGNLKVMYHGTPNGDFTVFKEGTYFTDNKAYADRYQSPGASSISSGKAATNPKTFEVYLNIKKPFDINDAEARNIYINEYIKGGNALGIKPYLSDAEYDKIQTIDWTEGEDLRDFLIENGYDYDGLVLDEGADGGYGDEVSYRGKSYMVFSPEQIKNTDNTKPTADRDIRYSLSSETERNYLDAVSRGDIETAQRMVDEVAKKAGYTTKAYHGTNAEFFTFDKDRVGKGTDQYGAGYYFASSKEGAGHYGSRVIDSVLKLENPYTISSVNLLDAEITLTDEQAYEIVKRHPLMYDPEESPLGDYYDSYWESGAEEWMVEDLAMQFTDLGYLDSDLFRYYPNELHEAVRDVTGRDGIVVNLSNGEKFYVAWFDNQMKSADPVTYDDDGNAIPLSQRFNPEEVDIRHSLSDKGEQFAPRTRFDVFGKDLMKVEEIAPVREAETAEAMFPDDLAPIADDPERFDSLTDEDAPPVRNVEYGEHGNQMTMPKSTVNMIAQNVKSALWVEDNQMGELHRLIDDYAKAEFPSREKLFQDLKDRFGTYTEKMADDTTQEVKKALRRYRLFVSDSVRGEIADYNDLRKRNFGKVLFSRQGTPVDVAYEELSNMYPGFFPKDIINPADQLLQIIDVVNRSHTSERHYEIDDQVVWDAVDDIIETIHDYQSIQREREAGRTQTDYLDDLVKRGDEYAPVVGDVAPVMEAKTESPKQSAKATRRKLAVEIGNLETEMGNNERLREQSNADFDAEIAKLQAEYDALKNKNTIRANDILRRIERTRRMKNNVDGDYARRIKNLEERIGKMSSPTYQTAAQRNVKQQEYTEQMESLVGDTTTWRDKKLGISYKVNTLRRNLRDVVRKADGSRDIEKADAIYDELQGKYNHNEAILNKEATQIKQPYAEMKITKAEDAYIQMLGELRHNPDTELTVDEVNEFYEKHKKNIDKAKVDRAIEMARKTYDELLVRVNEVLKEQGMKEIPYRKGYFPHFTEDKQSFLAKLFNWKTRNNDIPTDIAGLTENFNPNRSWQSFNKERKGDTTDYSFMKGMDTYVQGALDWVHHIEDIQKRRAFENHLRYIHSEKGVQERIDAIRQNMEYDADEMQEQIDLVFAEASNPLNNFVVDLRAGTNTLANKKSSMDRSMEEATNRKFYSVMTNISNRVSANMVGGSISSALTNFIPITQSWGQVSPVSSLRAMGDTIRSTFRDDGTIAKSDFLTNRLRKADNLYKSGWDKVSDGLGIMFDAIDSFTSQTVWRSKYLENISHGMSENEAIKNADQFAENVLAGRNRGNLPTVFDAKNPLVKTLTAFQLEVNNQYGYMFKDMPQDVNAKARLVKGYVTMFLGAYAYNALFSKLTGRDAAFDPIGIIEELLRDLGLFGDDEEEEVAPTDVVMNLTENILQEVPFVGGLMGGGRVPISSAMPYDGNVMDIMEGASKLFLEGDTSDLTSEWLKPVYYVVSPVGGGQIKKTVEGLSMFSDDHPIAGSYTKSGDLRFPVEDTFGSRVKAALFGQYASKNAREYFDNGYAPLKEKQIQEFIDLDIPIRDYWEYREGLSSLSKLSEKADYIADLDLPIAKKNLLINNIADREEDIDLTGYDDFGDFEEFDFAVHNPEKYKIAQTVGGYDAYMEYQEGMKGMKLAEKADYISGLDLTDAQKNALINGETDRKETIDMTGYNTSDYSSFEEFEFSKEYPEKYAVAKAVGGYEAYTNYSSELYDIKADKDKYGKSISGSRKEKVLDYINNLDADYYTRIILWKSEYPSDDSYNYEIIDYLNGRDDLSYEERIAILRKLGFDVTDDGDITW